MNIAVVILEKIGAEFAQDLAVEIGGGIVETLFNQQAINRNLEDIKSKLSQIYFWMTQNLPNVIYDKTKQVIAESTQYDAIEKINTVVGNIALIKKKKNAKCDPNDPQACIFARQEVLQVATDLNRSAVALFEKAGELITYGQAYYAVICVSFSTCINVYKELVEVDQDQFIPLVIRLRDWQGRLKDWSNNSVPHSLGYIDKTLDSEYTIAVNAFDGMDVRKQPHETRYLLSWERVSELDYITQKMQHLVHYYGCWFEFDGNRFLGDEPIGGVISDPDGIITTRDQLMAIINPEPNRYQDPKWFFNIVDNNRGGFPLYEACVYRLQALFHAMKNYSNLSPGAKKAVNLVRDMQAAIDAILEEPIAYAVQSNQLVASDPSASIGAVELHKISNMVA